MKKKEKREEIKHFIKCLYSKHHYFWQQEQERTEHPHGTYIHMHRYRGINDDDTNDSLSPAMAETALHWQTNASPRLSPVAER